MGWLKLLFGIISNGLAAASKWLALRKTKQDEDAGAAMQRDADEQKNRQRTDAELRADAQGNTLDDAIDRANKGKF